MFSQQSGLVDVREEAETISSTPSPSFSCTKRQCSGQSLWPQSKVCVAGLGVDLPSCSLGWPA